jgi:NAD(P)H-dependent flavin oxidoreductase YrpB (nitropropane dioxygenase family)
MSALLKFEVQAVWLECSQCHVAFALSSIHNEKVIAQRETFYCPNGHRQWYPGKTEAQKVREEMQAKLDAANATAEWAKGQVAKDAREVRKVKAKLKSHTKRIEAGVCIHCNRTFSHLARHMKSKHHH